jgi:small subunit ribosomal protein S6
MSTAVESSVSQTENLYEGMFLLNSTKFAADPEGVSGQVLGILEKAGATIEANRPWQDGKLAYTIEGHRKGLHYVVLFRMSGDRMPEINRACKLNELILRQLIIKHPQALFDLNVAALTPDEPEPDESSADEGKDGDKPAPKDANKEGAETKE